jgi:hypothetical protein
MLHLFVAPKSFEGWGDDPFDGATLSQLLALLILVAVGALALTMCLALVMFFTGEPVELLDRSRFPIPACLGISFSAWRATRRSLSQFNGAKRKAVGEYHRTLLLLAPERASRSASISASASLRGFPRIVVRLLHVARQRLAEVSIVTKDACT